MNLQALPPLSFPSNSIICAAPVDDLSKYHAHDRTGIIECAAAESSLKVHGFRPGTWSYNIWSESASSSGTLLSCHETITVTFSRSDDPSSHFIVPVTSEVEPSIVKAKYGNMMTLPSDVYVGGSLRHLGEWEDTIVSLLSTVIRPGDIVWEAGGHIGSHTIALGRLVTETGHVYTYEAHPTTRSVLSSNVLLNALQDRISVLPYGLSDESGRINLGSGCAGLCDGSEEVSKQICEQSRDDATAPSLFNGGNSGGFSLNTMSLLTAPASLDSLSKGPRAPMKSKDMVVDVTTFDRSVTMGYVEATCPKVIKTDLEGMDLKAIRGGVGSVTRCRPLLYMEAFSPLRRKWKEVGAFMEEVDYVCYYDTFLSLPSQGVAMYDSASNEESKAQQGVGMHQRSGAVSFNYVCHWKHDEDARASMGKFVDMKRIGLVEDPDKDRIYLGDDCEKISNKFTDAGVFDMILGGGRQSIC
jgi:FkbM family methyltransferase